MHTSPVPPARVNPDRLVNLADPPAGGLPLDAADEADLWAGYRAWCAATAAGDLLEWARATLPAPVLPCVCCDGGCLRCRVAALVEWGRPAA